MHIAPKCGIIPTLLFQLPDEEKSPWAKKKNLAVMSTPRAQPEGLMEMKPISWLPHFTGLIPLMMSMRCNLYVVII